MKKALLAALAITVFVAAPALSADLTAERLALQDKQISILAQMLNTVDPAFLALMRENTATVGELNENARAIAAEAKTTAPVPEMLEDTP